MRRGLVIIVLAFLLTIPITQAGNQEKKCSVETEGTTIILCLINGERIEKEMSMTSIKNLIDMGASHKEDFLTIYDKRKSAEEVTIAFENLQPFFQALADSGLTGKTVEELNTLYYTIRQKIGEPRHQPMRDGGVMPLAIWNGLPTPLWANTICGQFDVGMCAGFAGGTHLIIPTVGVDVFLTYAFQGTSVTVGAFGYTLAAMGFNFIMGFVGILLVTPLIMLGPYFLAGADGFMVGIGV